MPIRRKEDLKDKKLQLFEVLLKSHTMQTLTSSDNSQMVFIMLPKSDMKKAQAAVSDCNVFLLQALCSISPRVKCKVTDTVIAPRLWRLLPLGQDVGV